MVVAAACAAALCAPASASAVAFKAPVDYGVGEVPKSVAVGDFDNDGNQDLALANSFSGSVSVLLGDGSGGFGTAANISLGAGNNPVWVAVGDFNNDGDDDLAAALVTSDRVVILLGDGEGGFGPPASLKAGDDPAAVSVTVLDFNGDGNADLAVPNRDGDSVGIMVGDGEGNFATPTTSTVFAVGEAPWQAAVGDFDGDGNADLAVANTDSDNVSILLGDGSGGFGTAENFEAGDGPDSVAVGDFNGDGDADIAVVNGLSHDVSILLGDGEGGFSAPTNFGAGALAISVAVGDFDEDGNEDLAVANRASKNVSILLGDGTGSFTGAANVDSSHQANSVAVGDFNKDGDPDLAVADELDNKASVLLGLADPTISAVPDSSVTLGETVADTATLAGGKSPTGTITFQLFGPNDATCAGSPVYFSQLKSVEGDGNYSSGSFTPSEAGAYHWVVSYSGDAENGAAATACGESGQTSNVAKLAPTLTTEAGAGATVGQPITASATLDGGYEAAGEITFFAYGPDDADCSGTPAFSGGRTVDGDGEYDSPEFTPSQAGDYHWTAAYGGDANNEAVESPCGAAAQTTTVAKATPALTAAAADGTAGQALTDTATLASGYEAGGEITFRAYGPGDADCSGTPAFTSDPVSVDGDDEYESPEFTPAAAGEYLWTVSYSGDDNNATASVSCGAANQSSTVAKATPTLTASAADGTVGQAITDTASLGGVDPSGEITFRAYGPGASGCTGQPAFEEEVTVDSGDGDYESPEFTPSQPGAYNWTASYSGDDNNEAAASACLASGQTSTVAKAAPTLTGEAAATGTVGQPITDAATLAGGYQPGGQLSFHAYGPFDAGDSPDCTAPAAFAGTSQVDSGNGDYDSPAFTPTEPGVYFWTVGYAGDADNESAASACGDAEQTSTVAKAAPTLTASVVDGTVGKAVSATATLAGGYEAGGEITFLAYGPGDADCSGTPAFTSDPVAVDGDGEYKSDPFTPAAAGRYRWTVAYSGDSGNEAAPASDCDAPDSTSAVAKARTEITLSAAAASTTEGETATLNAAVEGFQPGGEVTFRDGAAALGTATVDAAGRASLATASLAAGVHQIVASYGGDANNDPSSSAPLAITVKARPAPAACRQVSPAPRNYKPKKKVRAHQVPGVRARITVATAAQLEIEASLRFKRDGRVRTVDLGSHSLGNPGARNLRLALPGSLRKVLPLRTKVTLKLKISAATGCGNPQVIRRSIRTRVVKVLVPRAHKK
jgi:hypothetical protein